MQYCLRWIFAIACFVIFMTIPGKLSAEVFIQTTQTFSDTPPATPDTLPVRVRPDTLPVATPDTLPVRVRPDTLGTPSDTSRPPASIIKPDTTPGVPPPARPVRTEQPAQAPTPAEAIPAREPFHPDKIYTAEWDSIYSFKPEVTRMYSAKRFFGPHLLPYSELLSPVKQEKEKSKDLFTVLIIASLILLAISRYFFPVRFRETLLASWETRFYNQLHREGDFFRNWVSVFFIVNFILVFGLLLYQSTEAIFPEILAHQSSQALVILAIILLMVAFYLIKTLIMYFLAWVFKTQRSTYSYLYNLLIINMFSGVMILPLLIINIFNPAIFYLYLAWGLLALLSLYKIIRGILIGLNASGFSAYYLILYLCAIEIAPLIFIIKYMQNV